MYYHVRVTQKSVKARSEVQVDLTEEQMRQRFLTPYELGEPIVINGKTIPSDDLERIQISVSPYPFEHYIPALREEDRKSSVVFIGGPSDEWRVAEQSEDVTDRFIQAPPGKGRKQRTSENTSPVRVFISYSHDSLEHNNRVLALSDRLRSQGVDCRIDQYEESPPQGWPRWMVSQIEQSDFVLMVCTDNYRVRFDGQASAGRGLGATWEGSIITQVLYDQFTNAKFIPVVFSMDDVSSIPLVMRSATYYNLTSENDYEGLYRRVTRQRLPIPPLGTVQPMLERRQFFLTSAEAARASMSAETDDLVLPAQHARHLLDKVLRIKDLMIAKVNGYTEPSLTGESEYPLLRFELLSDTRIRTRMPQSVRDFRTLLEVRAHYAAKLSNPDARVDSVRAGFSQLLDYLESPVLNTPGHKESVADPPLAKIVNRGPNKVFIVHGRSVQLKESTARLVERLGLEPIILGEQADKGRTLLEKFTQHAGEAAYAIVLLSRDDKGGAEPDETLRPRAKQNVILELGYFLGILGPDRVCAVYEGDVELPSDIAGRLYVPYDNSGMWRYRVAREMSAAGIFVDLNRL